ncbi:acetyltransferase [Sphingobacterium sp. ML3W]|uniref:DapH/DapD/GlmU-related protein n=1 Tax=Sphingobacterium sp. ML3W TaxID=1538644 RepID=UPI002499D527|nr:DapH/DapD/GlmU-related protein [Sphingobacterium sp. ML3W]WFA78209.1 acetyltransferase [Sphingobacterium sp. ML3W]
MEMYKRYGLLGVIRLLISTLHTRLFYPGARLIRLPFDVRNRRLIDLGNNLTTGFGCRLEVHPVEKNEQKCLIFGNNVQLNDYVHIAAGDKVVIGNDVLIASRVFISDLNHGSYTGEVQDSPLTKPNERLLFTKPVHIKDNVWIGENVCILPGVTIGRGCVIGSMSVVTKSIPDYSIAVGIPAKVVKQYDFETNRWVLAADIL